jgi:ElaB/YqjD/DUF883 family membrane-anchored ribosome-binding protein
MKTDRAMSASELKELSRSRLMEDVRAVVADAEDYLAASAGQSGEAYAAARVRLERTLDEVRAQVVGASRAVTEKTRAAARATDAYAHENPWEAVAVGAGVGLLLGWLMGRR